MYLKVIVVIGVQSIVIGNDGGRPSGRPSANKKFYNLQDIRLSDKLRLSLRGHDMHRPMEEE